MRLRRSGDEFRRRSPNRPISTYVDGHGDQLNGGRTCTLRLDPPPPVQVFWSLTTYDVPNFYLVATVIDRYSIGDRTPGIIYADDGSLTLTGHAKGNGVARNGPQTKMCRYCPLVTPRA